MFVFKKYSVDLERLISLLQNITIKDIILFTFPPVTPILRFAFFLFGPEKYDPRFVISLHFQKTAICHFVHQEGFG